eukprot:scaffold123957_cov54-Phaeocystis_antarctica.AAC.2
MGLSSCRAEPRAAPSAPRPGARRCAAARASAHRATPRSAAPRAHSTGGRPRPRGTRRRQHRCGSAVGSAC